MYTVSWKRHCFGLLHLLHSSSQYLPSTFIPAPRRTAQCSPDLRQQRTLSATRRTLADNAAGVQQQCRASSHCSARIDAIVLQVDWRRYSEHFFVREEDEVDSMFRELLKQQPQCRFRNTVYSITEKSQFSGFIHVAPGSADIGMIGYESDTANRWLAPSATFLPKITKKSVIVRWSYSVLQHYGFFETQCIMTVLTIVAKS